MVRPHSIDYLLIWVLNGRGWAETEGRRIDAHPGDLLTFTINKPHAYGADPYEPWDILWVHFDGQLAEQFFCAIRHRDTCVNLGLDGEIRDRWMELVVATAGQEAETALRGNTSLYGLLGLIAYRLNQRRSRATKDSPLNMYSTQKFIHERLTTPLTVATLAQQAHLSVPHYTRLFKRQFAVSPMYYVIQKRMALACSLLAETSMPLKQISGQVGYHDPYYFSRLFKKTVGQSPSAYRRHHRSASTSATNRSMY